MRICLTPLHTVEAEFIDSRTSGQSFHNGFTILGGGWRVGGKELIFQEIRMGVQHKTEFSSAITLALLGSGGRWSPVRGTPLWGEWFKSVLFPPLSVLSSPSPLLLFLHLILFSFLPLSSLAFRSLHSHHDMSSSGHHTADPETNS